MRILLSLLLAIAVLAPISLQAVQIMEDEDYLAVHVEAEEYSNKDERWYLYSDSVTPDVTEDPDGSHISGASDSSYMEVLPDNRVTGEDSGVDALWPTAGTGPSIDYTFNIPETGRYMVYVRSYSTGTEDNSVHAGINGSWPIDARTLQVPCGPKRAWIWGNKKRTEDNHCGDPDFPVYLDVAVSGVNTISFSAREDGFELDSFFLIKNKNAEERICSPSNLTDISCKNGSFKFEDGFVDIKTSVATDETNVREGDTLTITHTISNEDKRDTANNVEMTAFFSDDMTYEQADSTDCVAGTGQVVCSVGTLTPQASKVYEIQYSFPTVGDQNYTVSTTVDESDDDTSNNAAAIGVTVYTTGPVADIEMKGRADKNPVGLLENVIYQFTATNKGLDASPDVTLSATLPNATKLVLLDSNCSGSIDISCQLGAISTNESKSVTLVVQYTAAASYDFTMASSATYDDISGNDAATVTVHASEGKLFEESAGGMSVEAEDFAVNQVGTDAGNSAWYIVSQNVVPDPSIYDDTNSLASASSGAYVVALSDSSVEPEAEGSGAVLSYRLFFNTIGTYFLTARVDSADHNSRIEFSLDEATPQFLQLCSVEDDWNWTKASNVEDTCRLDVPVEIIVASTGEHILNVRIKDNAVELDKFALSKDPNLSFTGSGVAATEYADKDVDLSLQLSSDSFEVTANVEKDLEIILSNNNSMAAASDIEVIFDGIESFVQDSLDGTDCTLSESDDGQIVICKINTISPSQSSTISIPVMLTQAGTYTGSVSVKAEQSDSNQSNNTSNLTIIVSALGAAAASTSGSVGGVGWLLVLTGLALLGLRKSRFKR